MFKNCHNYVSCALLSLTLVALPLALADDKNAAKGKVVADSKFRPNVNGFGFENWGGDEYPYSDLKAADALNLFGDRVCARWENDKCIPTPAAKLWLKQMNQSMKGGHCEGMAAMSAAFHTKKEATADYGANKTFALKPKERTLMTTISSYFVTQSLEPVQEKTSKTRDWSLQKIVDFIISTLRSGTDYSTLGIYGPDGGHAITPYMVEDLGGGRYRIYVYDNNYPGAEKYIDVDTKKDRWVYAGAALNPKEDPSPWEGGAGAMDVTALSWRYEPLECPFCGGHKPPRAPARKPAPSRAPFKPRSPSSISDAISIMTPNRCSQIQAIRSKDKKQLSRGKNGSKNEIAGAFMRPMRGSRGCYVRLPLDQQYDLRLVDDGRPYYNSLTDLVAFLPGDVYSMSNIALSSGTTQSFSVGRDRFRYRATGAQKPTLRVAGDRAGSNGSYEVSGFTLGDGYEFGAARDSNGRIAFSDNGPALKTYDIKAEEVSESRSRSYTFNDVNAGEDGQVMMDLDESGMSIDIDSDSDGTADDLDTDDDNDKVLDASDTDDDGDGTSDVDDHDNADFDDDTDNDGIDDDADTDDDNDGVADTADTDDDNDGVADADEHDDEDVSDASDEDGDDTVDGDEAGDEDVSGDSDDTGDGDDSADVDGDTDDSEDTDDSTDGDDAGDENGSDDDDAEAAADDVSDGDDDADVDNASDDDGGDGSDDVVDDAESEVGDDSSADVEDVSDDVSDDGGDDSGDDSGGDDDAGDYGGDDGGDEGGGDDGGEE